MHGTSLSIKENLFMILFHVVSTAVTKQSYEIMIVLVRTSACSLKIMCVLNERGPICGELVLTSLIY